MTGDDNYLKDLAPDAALARRTWINSVREHFAKEHQRWGESLFRNLLLANTGGVAVVAALMGQISNAIRSTPLKFTLTCFVLGAASSLFSIFYEFNGVSRRLEAWDKCAPRYLRNEISFGEMHGPDRFMGALSCFDWFVLLLPGCLFLVGCGFALGFIWLS